MSRTVHSPSLYVLSCPHRLSCPVRPVCTICPVGSASYSKMPASGFCAETCAETCRTDRFVSVGVGRIAVRRLSPLGIMDSCSLHVSVSTTATLTPRSVERVSYSSVSIPSDRSFVRYLEVSALARLVKRAVEERDKVRRGAGRQQQSVRRHRRIAVVELKLHVGEARRAHQ